MKKILSVLLVVAMLMSLTCSLAFAATTVTQEGDSTVPVELTVPAVSEEGIEFTINEKIRMSASAGSTALTIDSLIITNTKNTGSLEVDAIQVVERDGWTIVANDQAYFEAVAMNTQEFGIALEDHDFATADTVTFTDRQIAPSSSQVFRFTGNIGTFQTAMTATVADVVATISVYGATVTP